MIQKKKPGVDVVLDILKEAQAANPESAFVNSLLFQYQERGGLSKKQLEGLYGKASKLETVSAAKLATLQAIILKKHEKHKSAMPVSTVVPFVKDESVAKAVNDILEKFPAHKRVLFYKNKIDNNETLASAEKEELERFKKILLKS